jgi:tetratricopeptide (TPR) repeat protein
MGEVGEVLAAQGNLDEALKNYRDDLAITERLAKSDPDNAGWQRDLSVVDEKVGEVLVAQGHFDEALKNYRDDLAITERLAKSDPSNAGWQRDLSVVYGKVANVLVAESQPDEALKNYRDDLAITERLAKSDPDNAGWQRDLSVVDEKVGDVLVAQDTRVDEIVDDLSQAKNLRILVLDSCRVNPLADELSRSMELTRGPPVDRGIARMIAPKGMIISFATQPNQTAADGQGRNSPYTMAFLKNIEAPEEIGTVFHHMTADVYNETQGKQLPELSLSYIGDFYLKDAKSEVAAISTGNVPGTEVTGEFATGERGPSHIYPEIASAAQKNFGLQWKRTFATKSATTRHSLFGTKLGDIAEGCLRFDFLHPVAPFIGHSGSPANRRASTYLVKTSG